MAALIKLCNKKPPSATPNEGLPLQIKIERLKMLNSETLKNENNIRNPSMTDITKEDFENVSLFAHHIGLKALFGVLANHNSTLADDIALELNQAQNAIQQTLPEKLQPYVNTQLQKWIDALKNKERSNG